VAIVRRIATSVVMLLAWTGVGAAASMSVSADSLGAAAANTPRCITSALSILPNLSSGTILSVTVGTIPAACGGATLQLTVDNGLANASGSSIIPAAGGSVTVTLASTPALLSAVQIDLVVVGP
jgi:uncharacterized membrane protein YeaQ/YmgE (transglycosylase-associated protein family)